MYDRTAANAERTSENTFQTEAPRSLGEKPELTPRFWSCLNKNHPKQKDWTMFPMLKAQAMIKKTALQKEATRLMMKFRILLGQEMSGFSSFVVGLTWTNKLYMQLFSLYPGYQLDGVAPLVTDPSHAKFITRQNSPICNPPLYIATTSETIMQIQNNLVFGCTYRGEYSFKVSAFMFLP